MSSVWISLMFPHGFAFVTGILYRWYSIFPKASNLEVYGERKKVKLLSRARLFATPWIVACTKLLCPWDFQGKSTGVGCHFLLQGIFPTQGSNPGLSHCRQMLYCLSHQGSQIAALGLTKTHSHLPLQHFICFPKCFPLLVSICSGHIWALQQLSEAGQEIS